MKIFTKLAYLVCLNRLVSKRRQKQQMQGVNVVCCGEGGIFLTALDNFCFGRYYDPDGICDGNYTIDIDRIIGGLATGRTFDDNYSKYVDNYIRCLLSDFMVCGDPLEKAIAGYDNELLLDIADDKCRLFLRNSKYDRLIASTKDVYAYTGDFYDTSSFLPKKIRPLMQCCSNAHLALNRNNLARFPKDNMGALQFYIDADSQHKLTLTQARPYLHERIFVLNDNPNFIGSIMSMIVRRPVLEAKLGVEIEDVFPPDAPFDADAVTEKIKKLFDIKKI